MGPHQTTRVIRSEHKQKRNLAIFYKKIRDLTLIVKIMEMESRYFEDYYIFKCMNTILQILN